ncbi:MAG: flagellar basal body rod protein FlgC, partial [Synergistaceae bacterium]|nr:flagellar basal body rod protein FlgC [Synergistaceae bacterium]
MRIFDSLEVAGSSLTAHRLWMDTISSNLANINT